MENTNSKKCSLFKEMLEDLKQNRQNMLELLQQVLNVQIKDVEFLGTENFDSITEYKFSVFIINVIYEDNFKQEIYLKLIKAGKIKESIFCYWSLLYEEYYGNEKEKVNNLNKKTVISQKTANQGDSSIILKLEDELDYSAEVNLVDLNNFIVKNVKNLKIERWLEGLEIADDDILFIGKKRY